MTLGVKLCEDRIGDYRVEHVLARRNPAGDPPLRVHGSNTSEPHRLAVQGSLHAGSDAWFGTVEQNGDLDERHSARRFCMAEVETPDLAFNLIKTNSPFRWEDQELGDTRNLHLGNCGSFGPEIDHAD